MRTDNSEGKRNQTVSLRKGPGSLKALEAVCRLSGRLAAVCICLACFPLPAEAAPATLTSPDAAVYEQADEGSSQVGNLVEGSSFEYIGDVTAEDGSVWRQITTAGGVNGYIRGDREIETGREEPVPEEQGGQEAAPLEGENAAAENEPEDGVEGAAEEAPEDGGEDEESSEENGELEEDNTVAATNMQNNQAKTYVIDSSAKIKERANFAGSEWEVQNEKSPKAGIDMALIVGMVVVLFCAMVIYICLIRMRILKNGTGGSGTSGAGRDRIHRKIDKKKRRKAKKAARGGKRV